MAQLIAQPFHTDELSEAWIEGDQAARWRSASAHGPSMGASHSGSSLMEIAPGSLLPRHTDSAEEVIVVVRGQARVLAGDEEVELGPGGVGAIPANLPHEVRSVGEERLRFVAVYADSDVVTTYEEEVQPDGSRQRKPVK
jgi:mannose-6-phosphate isomerase-like protein (cupin superfamily)